MKQCGDAIRIAILIFLSYNRTGSEGKDMGPKSAKINSAIFFVPIVLGMLLALDFRAIFVIPYAIGFWFFLKAKLSLLKQGKFVSFGSKDMTIEMKRAYYIGYAIMIVTAVLNIMLVIQSNYRIFE